MKDSPLYQIYHIGSEEISHRLDKMSENKIEGLPGRSIQAIRASLDAGLVHENHRLTDGLVYLTISVAGGPYVGLLGTVVGVMITFALIAKSGEVNVNYDRARHRLRAARHRRRPGRRHPRAVHLQLSQRPHQETCFHDAGLHRRVRRQDGRVLPPARTPDGSSAGFSI
jgi:hypothetical protein